MTAMATTFTRMDESTAEKWAHIGAEHVKDQPRTAETVLTMLRSLEDLTVGCGVNQLVHSLQPAPGAERAGADDELVIAALCHDIGKVASAANPPAIAA